MGKRSNYAIIENHTSVLLNFVKHKGDYLCGMKLEIIAPFNCFTAESSDNMKKQEKQLNSFTPVPSRIFLVLLQNILLKLVSFVSEMQYVTMTKSKFIMP